MQATCLHLAPGSAACASFPREATFPFWQVRPLAPFNPLVFPLFLPCSTSPCQTAVVGCLLSQGQQRFASSTPFSAQIPPELSWPLALRMLQAARVPAARSRQPRCLCSPGGFSFFGCSVPLRRARSGLVCALGPGWCGAAPGRAPRLSSLLGLGEDLLWIWLCRCHVGRCSAKLRCSRACCTLLCSCPCPAAPQKPFGHLGITATG